jgi:hypothetical protein
MEFEPKGVWQSIQHELEGSFMYENESSIPDDLLDEITTHISNHIGLSPDPELTMKSVQSTLIQILNEGVKSKESLYLYGQDHRSESNRSLIISKFKEGTVIEILLSYYDYNGREVGYRHICEIEADLTEEKKTEALSWIKDCFEKIKSPTDQWFIADVLMRRYKELTKEIKSQQE